MTIPLTSLRGIGARTAAALEAAGIPDVDGLLWQFPVRYDDRRAVTRIGELRAGDRVVIRAAVRRVGGRQFGARSAVRLTVEDATGAVEIVYFNQPYRRSQFAVGAERYFAGEVTDARGTLTLLNADVAETPDAIGLGALVPHYPTPDGIRSARLAGWVRQALDYIDVVPPVNLPGVAPSGEPWMSRRDALLECHRPSDPERLDRARLRLRFEELYSLQHALAARRARFVQSHGVTDLNNVERSRDVLVEALPFSLTAGQCAALDAIAGDLASGRPMYRLVHGDVGSGKTAVAAVAAGIVARAGWQAAVLAPTEVLAEQWTRAFAELLAPAGVEAYLVTGRLAAADRNAIESDVAAGRAGVVVGTHALLSDSVAFSRLGLVVVDEEQRFGVAQRDRLRGKGPAPHVLVLSATPIPRTLALTAYGDLDVTTIADRPPGRAARTTIVVEPNRAPGAWRFVAERIEREGGRAFVVCPSIDAAGGANARSATATASLLEANGFGRLGIGLLHGRLRSEEKAAIVARFRAGEIGLLVATTVVEVGIDVPSADVMVILNPARFGLSQLHQLRGRVGRGGRPAWCLPMLDGAEADDARERLALFAEHDDGFRLAEEDLRRRGPGELLGVRQHGLPSLRLADPRYDTELLERARAAAFEQDAISPPRTCRP